MQERDVMFFHKSLFDESPIIQFDGHKDTEFPNGAWQCGFDGGDQFFALTPNDALKLWWSNILKGGEK